jgi:hypothetical protein
VSKKLLLPFFILILSVFGFAFSKSLAQSPSSYDVTVSPIFFDLITDPGGTIADKVRVRNNTSSPIPIKLGLEKLTGDINGNLALKQDKNDYTLSWVKFSQNTFVAKPLEWTEIPFTVNVPKDAAFGYYWAITFTQDVTSPLAKTGVSLTGAAGVPILLNVRKEGAKADAKIQQFFVKDFISEYLPVDFTVKIENTGNIHIRPHGNIFVSDGRNKSLAILDVNPGLGNVLPNSGRIFNASWNDGFLVREPVIEDGQPKLDKNGKQVEKLTINWNKLTSFRVGRYTANLLLVFDNGKRDIPLEGTVSFWVLPYKAIIAIILSLVITFFVIRWLLGAYIGREVRRRMKTA